MHHVWPVDKDNKQYHTFANGNMLTTLPFEESLFFLITACMCCWGLHLAMELAFVIVVDTPERLRQSIIMLVYCKNNCINGGRPQNAANTTTNNESSRL